MTNIVPKNALLSQKSKNIWEGNSSKEPIQYSKESRPWGHCFQMSPRQGFEDHQDYHHNQTVRLHAGQGNLEAEDEQEEWEVTPVQREVTNIVPKNALLSQKSKNIWEGNSSKEPIQYIDNDEIDIAGAQANSTSLLLSGSSDMEWSGERSPSQSTTKGGEKSKTDAKFGTDAAKP